MRHVLILFFVLFTMSSYAQNDKRKSAWWHKYTKLTSKPDTLQEKETKWYEDELKKDREKLRRIYERKRKLVKKEKKKEEDAAREDSIKSKMMLLNAKSSEVDIIDKITNY